MHTEVCKKEPAKAAAEQSSKNEPNTSAERKAQQKPQTKVSKPELLNKFLAGTGSAPVKPQADREQATTVDQKIALYGGPAPKASSKSSKNIRQGEQLAEATPMLDALPPLRRAQYLQVILRYMKKTEKNEDAKLPLSEEFLNKFDGDCMNAQQHVKDLADATGTT